jgi:chromosome segregation ATPase
VAEAGQDLEEQRGRAQEARRERDRQHRQVAELEERMNAARAGEQQAESQLRQAEKQVAEAERRARSAQDKLDKARAGLDLEGTAQ